MGIVFTISNYKFIQFISNSMWLADVFSHYDEKSVIAGDDEAMTLLWME